MLLTHHKDMDMHTGEAGTVTVDSVATLTTGGTLTFTLYTDPGLTSENQVASAQLTINTIYSVSMVADFGSGDYSSYPSSLSAMGGKLYQCRKWQ